MSPLRPPIVPLGILLALACGCAARTEPLQKQLAELEREVRVLRSEGATLRERLDAVEEQAGKRAPAAAGQPVAEASATRAADRPRLEVIRLTPEAEGADGWVTIDPSDPRRVAAAQPAGAGAPTTEIRSERGGGVVQRPASSAAAPPSTTPTPAPAPASRK
ncbi:MAG: type II secretion system protein M [Deltaproteobacteria bacterium]|nr:type II secretion system protein M [Deltaproteobacteria bacterium]